MKSKDFYNIFDETRWGRESLPQYEDLLSQLIESYVKDSDIVVELGCGKGALKQCHPKYIGVDISYVALKKYLDGKMRIQADIERIPVKSSFASLVFSIVTLEHVPSPENCLTEIDRILRPGGIAVLAPAWFCRPWAAKGLPVKKYSELGVLDKKISYPFEKSYCVERFFGYTQEDI